MDLQAIKSRLSTLQQKKGGGNGKNEREKYFWKPPVGKYSIRIVPSLFNKSNPFREVMIHYGIGNKTMISLTNFGEKDPIVEFAQQLKKTNEKDNWALAKKISPKMRVFVPVVVRGEEEKGVRLWEFGREMYLELLNIAEDEEVGDYTDITQGHDLTIDTVGPDVTGTKYNKSSVRVRLKKTPLSEDSTLVTKWLNEQPDVLQFYKKYEFEEMKNVLMEWLEPSETETADEDEAPFDTTPQTPAQPAANYTLNTKAKKGFNEDEFDDLFND